MDRARGIRAAIDVLLDAEDASTADVAPLDGELHVATSPRDRDIEARAAKLLAALRRAEDDRIARGFRPRFDTDEERVANAHDQATGVVDAEEERARDGAWHRRRMRGRR